MTRYTEEQLERGRTVPVFVLPLAPVLPLATSGCPCVAISQRWLKEMESALWRVIAQARLHPEPDLSDHAQTKELHYDDDYSYQWP